MSDNKITQDQLEPNVMEELESGIGDLSTLSTENKDSLVAAVTEIYGKNVIAEAIGEPLAVTDTFSEMGSEINSLLSSFKTNMMNSGVTVESGDKFKQLIDKIKGLTEGEGNVNSSLDIISATELPDTGRENQICVVTNNPVGSFVVTSEEDFTSVDKIVVFTTSNSPNYEVTNNNLLCRYCIDSVFLNDMLLDSYYYKNSTWNRLTFSSLGLLYQGRYMMESIHGGLYSGEYIKYTPDAGIVIKPSNSTGSNIISAFSFKKKIDLTSYNTIEITLKGSNTISSFGCYILASTSTPFNYVGSFTNQTVLKEQSLSLGTDYRTYTFDITSAKGEYYIGFGGYTMNYTITISDFKIC